MTLREMSPLDVDALISLWVECFGDDERVARSYYRRVGAKGVVAERDGGIISMMNISPIELKLEGKTIKGGFVYAACTAVRERGKGTFRALNAYAEEYMRRRGMEFLMLIPAHDGLFPMYRSMGYVCEAYPAVFSRVDGADFDGNTDGLYSLYLRTRKTPSFVKSRGLFEYALDVGDRKIEISEGGYTVYAPDGRIYESTEILCAGDKPKALFKWAGRGYEIKEKLTADFFGEDAHNNDN